MSTVVRVRFSDHHSSIARALELIGAAARLPKDRLIIIKPNLTNSSPPPVTTDVAAAEALLDYLQANTTAPIAIGEGCGQGTTGDLFEKLGYKSLAEARRIELIDFNRAPAVLLENDTALQLKELYLPAVVLDAFIISLPVLKDHSFTATTIAMKNMFGLPPGRCYKGAWNKSALHSPSTDRSVVDICLYKKPDLSVVDASVALAGMHLCGTKKKLGLILASFDPVAVDALGSKLLGHDPQNLPYLTLADGRLGDMDHLEILDA